MTPGDGHHENLLAVSVGNTRTRLGAFVDGALRETATLENRAADALPEALEHAFAELRAKDDTGVVLASVNPPVSERVAATIAEVLRVTPLRVERDLLIPVGRQLDPEALVGDDRLLNAAAAFDALKQACVVVDAGTAVTVDFVDGAGTFHGGAIAPGAQLMLDAMTQRTALLPEVEFDRPSETVGHNTVQAMRAGVFSAITGMVYTLTERYAEVAGSFPLVVVTGGDGPLLFKDDPRVDRLVPDLTLLGIALTWRTARQQARDE